MRKLTCNTNISILAVSGISLVAISFVVSADARIMTCLVTRTVPMSSALSLLADPSLADVSIATLAVGVTPPDTLSTGLKVDIAVLVRGAVVMRTTRTNRTAGSAVTVESIVAVIVAALYLQRELSTIHSLVQLIGYQTGRRVFLQVFRVLPNFHECFYNSIETRRTCFLFLLENIATKKKTKTTC